MKVLIFADSHGYNMAMAFAVDREEPDAVIHLGDHAEDAREIERVFPLCRSAVCGATTILIRSAAECGCDTGRRADYITHGHRERVGMLSSGIVPQRAYEEHCALAFFGHTHRMMLERENGVWVCNPGSISLPRGGPASYARLTVENGRAALLELVDEDGSLLRKESL